MDCSAKSKSTLLVQERRLHSLRSPFITYSDYADLRDANKSKKLSICFSRASTE